MSGTFYLAAGFSRRVEMHRLGQAIERQTGWVCTARWLTGYDEGFEEAVIADNDIQDVRRADRMVLHHGTSTRGGKWVELGMAIAQGKQILIVREPRPETDPAPPLPHFAWAPTVTIVRIVDRDVAFWTVGRDSDPEAWKPAIRGFRSHLVMEGKI